MLKAEIRRAPSLQTAAVPAHSFSKFGGAMDGMGELRRALAEVGLDRLINPGPSAPRP
jgi:hypothetical protein